MYKKVYQKLVYLIYICHLITYIETMHNFRGNQENTSMYDIFFKHSFLL